MFFIISTANIGILRQKTTNLGIAKVLQNEKHRWNGQKLHHRTCSVYCDTEQKKRFPMAKVHKSVGNGRGEIKAGSTSLRLYTVKLRPICPKNNAKSSTSLSVLQYWAASTRVLCPKYCSTCKEVLTVSSFFWFVKEVNVNSASTWLVQERHRYRYCVQALPLPTDLWTFAIG